MIANRTNEVPSDHRHTPGVGAECEANASKALALVFSKDAYPDRIQTLKVYCTTFMGKHNTPCLENVVRPRIPFCATISHSNGRD